MIALRAPSIERAAADLGVTPVAVDAATLAEHAARALALAAGQPVAWSMAIVRPGAIGWVLTRARRIKPVVLEDACEALRHAGVVDVRVTQIDGAVPTVVVSGRARGA